jgi:integrase
MAGARALTPEEVELIFQKLGHKRQRYGRRNQLLFLFGIKTGFRVSEILSVKVSDVIQFGKVVDKVTVTKDRMKGRRFSRTVVLHPDLKPLIRAWVKEANLELHHFLFCSQKKGGFPLRRETVHDIFMEAYSCLQLTGQIGCHATRKTFATRVYENTGHDILKTQKALGHRFVSTTLAYLEVDQEAVDEAILAG